MSKTKKKKLYSSAAWSPFNVFRNDEQEILESVIYTRVSSKEQADGNKSLDTQMKACMGYAEKNNLIIKESFGGTYESAKTDERRSLHHWQASPR